MAHSSAAAAIPVSHTQTGDEHQTICQVCVMDDSDPNIVFYGEAGCNHCIRARSRLANEYFPDARGAKLLEERVQRMKRDGAGKAYDCVAGVSGGVDSTYVAWLAKQHGLRVLAVHLDNGWNSEVAVKNIENTVVKLGIDLVTHVIDWAEIKDLQRAYFSVPVLNIEAITDHAIFAVLYHEAAKHGVKYILSGSNVAMESIMPIAWSYDQRDLRNVMAIHRRHGQVRLKTYPRLSALHFLYYVFIKKIKFIPVLNFIPYVKQEVIKTLQEQLGWRPYPNKHGESMFTRFFQEYYLPAKFGFDKRKAHLSSLIASGQMGREEALAQMNTPLYRPEALAQEVDYVLKKLGFSAEEWQHIMDKPAVKHTDLPNNQWMFSANNAITRRIKRYAKAGIG